MLPWLKARLGPDRLVAAGTFGTAFAMLLYALARHPAPAFVASMLAGASWIAVLASLNVSAQLALPEDQDSMLPKTYADRPGPAGR